MNIIKVKDYKEMSQTAADYVIKKVLRKPHLKLGLATGNTPGGLYKELVCDHKKNGTSYENVSTFNLDEYIGLPAYDSHSYRYYMDKYLFDHININKMHTHLPLGDAKDEYAEALAYEKLIHMHGKIDLQILGIGRNGHIGFNEPGTSFSSITHVVNLMPSTREANAKFFGTLEAVPFRAISMGIASIMKSEEILLLVSGKEKSDALYKLVKGEINENFPASILKNHENFTLIADEETIFKSGLNEVDLDCRKGLEIQTKN